MSSIDHEQAWELIVDLSVVLGTDPNHLRSLSVVPSDQGPSVTARYEIDDYVREDTHVIPFAVVHGAGVSND